MRETRRKK